MSESGQPSAADLDQRRPERRARMALACVSDPGDLSLCALIADEGAVRVWRSLAGVRQETRWGQRAARVDLARVDIDMRRFGLRYVIPGDAEWPAALDDLAHVTWTRLGGPPLGLWVTGPGNLAEWARPSVAVVGSRAATGYGNTVAADLAADLAESGITVVSGGAYGIDVSAHRAVLGVGGRTIAVLAGGIDEPYPRGNARVFEALRCRGLILSELPPRERPTRSRFLGRNRVIAALTAGTVVVEAALRSGARNTVSWASECHRTVMAVPGPVGSECSAGTHELIRSREAELVTCAAHVRELIASMGQDVLPMPRGPERRLDGLSTEQKEVFEAVPGRGGRTAEEIAVRAGVPLLSALTLLEELAQTGLVDQSSGGGWKMRPGVVG